MESGTSKSPEPKSRGKQRKRKTPCKKDKQKGPGQVDKQKGPGQVDKQKGPGQVDKQKGPGQVDKQKGPGQVDKRDRPKKPTVLIKRLRHQEALKQKNLNKLEERTEGEKFLEDLVFGGEDDFVDKLLSDAKAKPDPSDNFLKGDTDDESEEDSPVPIKKPAWIDQDDEVNERILMTHRYRKDMRKSAAEKVLDKEKLQSRLQQEFQKAMGGVPSWALRDPKKKVSQEDDDGDEEDEDNLLSKTGNLLAKSTFLPKGILQIRSCIPANAEGPSEGGLNTVQFHPLAQVVMTAGFDRTISLFQVDGRTNPKIQSIFLEDFPIGKARFSADGEQVIATGLRHKHFYVYNMISGDIIPVPNVRGLGEKRVNDFEVSPDGSFLLLKGTCGYIHLLSMKTKELIGSMKMNTETTRSVFSPDATKIFSSTDVGEVYVWDVKSRRCLNRFTDDGSLMGTSLAVSRDGRYLSCGSSSGVVNVYNYEDCLNSPAPKPVKSLMNLVTAASLQAFNPTTEIMAIASAKLLDAVKLVHIPSFTVFSNFPRQGKKTIYKATSMDFSPNSGYFSIANNKGTALLYRLKHYSDF